MTRPALTAAAAAALGISFAAGRYSRRPVTVDRVVTRDVVHTVTAEQHTASVAQVLTVEGPTRVVWRKLDCPSGKPSEEIIEERGPVRTEAATQQAARTEVQTRDVEHVVEKVRMVPVRDDWHAAALVGWHGAPVYGASVDRRIAGPLTLGVAATTERAVYVTVGVRW